MPRFTPLTDRRDQVLSVRMSQRVKDIISDLAARYGVSQADLMAGLVVEEQHRAQESGAAGTPKELRAGAREASLGFMAGDAGSAEPDTPDYIRGQRDQAQQAHGVLVAQIALLGLRAKHEYEREIAEERAKREEAEARAGESYRGLERCREVLEERSKALGHCRDLLAERDRLLKDRDR
jgi:hypothetical protein